MDELHARLDRLAPPVAAHETERALVGVHAAIRRRRVVRQRLSIAAALLVVLVLASGIALARQNSDGADGGGVLTADGGPSSSVGRGSSIPRAGSTAPATDSPTTSITPPGTEDPSPVTTTRTTPIVEPSTTAPGIERADPSEVELRVTLDNGPVVVGTRARFTVAVVNHSRFEAGFKSGGCGPTAFGVSGMPGYDVHPAPWNGPVGMLRAHLDAGGNDLSNHWGEPVFPANGGAVQLCFANLRLELLAPGDTLTRHYVWDAVVAPGITELPRVLTARATVEVTMTGDLSGATTTVAGTTSIPLADDANVHPSPAAFLTNIDKDPVLTDWLRRNNGFPLIGSHVSLGYANGGFELWIDLGAARLRVRGDATTGAITEIRVLDSINAPSDDPDNDHPSPETILFPG
jgi:hypothetical protein